MKKLYDDVLHSWNM